MINNTRLGLGLGLGLTFAANQRSEPLCDLVASGYNGYCKSQIVSTLFL